jgi:hypothetical protein
MLGKPGVYSVSLSLLASRRIPDVRYSSDAL